MKLGAPGSPCWASCLLWSPLSLRKKIVKGSPEAWIFLVWTLRAPTVFAGEDSETVPGLVFAPKLSRLCHEPLGCDSGNPLWLSCCWEGSNPAGPSVSSLRHPAMQSPLSERLLNKDGRTHAPATETMHIFTRLPCILHRCSADGDHSFQRILGWFAFRSTSPLIKFYTPVFCLFVF